MLTVFIILRITLEICVQTTDVHIGSWPWAVTLLSFRSALKGSTAGRTGLNNYHQEGFFFFNTPSLMMVIPGWSGSEYMIFLSQLTLPPSEQRLMLT